jgi:hypothetical protein
MALAREVHAREILVERDGDERVGLVVAQADVEARAVLLDEALLCQQRLGLGGDHDGLDVRDAGDHLGVAWGAGDVGAREVRGDALADRLCLAHVDDAVAGVAEQIDPRLVGQGASLGRKAAGDELVAFDARAVASGRPIVGVGALLVARGDRPVRANRGLAAIDR